MRTATLILPFLLSSLSAQQLVRGDVDVVRNTNNVFKLDCTNVFLTSRTVNLLTLHNNSRQKDIEYEMMVRDVSTGGKQILEVLSAKAIPEMFGMGNIRLGRSDTWQVLGAPGSAVGIFVTVPSFTSYAPFGASGSWLMGTNHVLFARGTTNAVGRYQLRYQPPNVPSLVGQVFVGQAALVRNNVITLSNADCKTVRSR